jgi:hypothetical protein
MAKKQTRRSISVSRTTYERLKAFCETNHISMSQLVETRVNDFLGPNEAGAVQMAVAASSASASMIGAGLGAPSAPRPFAARPVAPVAPSRPVVEQRPAAAPVPAASTAMAAAPQPPAAPPPMTSAAARFAVDPPPPIIKPRQDTGAPKPAEKRPEQIFTF